MFGAAKVHFHCIASDGPCEGTFTESMLREILPEQVMTAFDELAAQEALKLAEIDNLVTCRRCALKVEMLPSAGVVLTCPQCGAETCRLCGDEGHAPLRCEEVEKEGDKNHRLVVEEAMTNARVRECPKCKSRFYKTEGCNKMTCSCGTLICYICRKNISKDGYNHFCQQGDACKHKSFECCRLFTNTVDDDRLAMRDAGIKALQQATDAGADTQAVDINKLLEGASTSKQ